MDSYGRKFPYEDSESTEDTICIIQAIDLVGDILPFNKLPSDTMHENIQLILAPKSTSELNSAGFLIESYKLIFS